MMGDSSHGIWVGRLALTVAAALALAACGKRGGQTDVTPLPADDPQFVAALSEQYTKGKTPGQDVFNRNCSFCHADAPIMPGTLALATRYEGKMPGALEKRKDLTPETIRYFVRNGISIMPGFRKSEISDKELNDLIGYLSKK